MDFAMGDAGRWWIGALSGLGLPGYNGLLFPEGDTYVSAGHRSASPGQVSNSQGMPNILAI
ncbi:MAG: hypothetical protein V4577_23765 [Bacteroidota bacterium]